MAALATTKKRYPRRCFRGHYTKYDQPPTLLVSLFLGSGAAGYLRFGGACLRFPTKFMQQHIFQFCSEPQNTSTTPRAPSSHCSSVQERLATYGSEALDSSEHLGLIIGNQTKATALLEHFGSITTLARASMQELLPFLSRTKAVRLVSSLRLGAVALRQERQQLTIDNPLAIAELRSEMRFLDRELLRVVRLNTLRQLEDNNL
jgi:hypothetical protein